MSPRIESENKKIRTEKKELIMETALELFAEESYHGVSISKIAETAGISKGSMYSYFESKEDLLFQIGNEGFDIMTGILGIENQKITENDLEKYIRDSFSVLKGNSHHWKLYFSLFFQPNIMKMFEQKLLENIKPIIEKLTVYFTEKGCKNPYAKTRLFMATLDGVGMNMVFEPDTYPAEEVMEMLIEQFKV